MYYSPVLPDNYLQSTLIDKYPSLVTFMQRIFAKAFYQQTVAFEADPRKETLTARIYQIFL